MNGSPGELQLNFTQRVVVALARVRVTVVGGEPVVTETPTGEGSSSSTLHVRLDGTLSPGTYRVTWQVVSVDTHPTSGSYKFTVAP